MPKEISRRLYYFLTRRNLSILQAMNEVLTPAKKEISCIYSDIRGFTEQTKELDTFVGKGVLPNVKECTSAIEENSGIPRKIGDLIFAYFDADSVYVNVVRSLRAGAEIATINEAFNESNPDDIRIKRHVLVSSGPAIVGNLGGLDSSIEITALGSPVNLLSRIDELTKEPQLGRFLNDPCIALCARTAELLFEMDVGLEPREICLDTLGLQIRNFEDQKTLWILPVDSTTLNKLHRMSNYVDRNHDQRLDIPN